MTQSKNDNGPQLLSRSDLRQILDVTRKLAAPFDLATMLEEVVDAARAVLRAERGTVYLYDEAASELSTSVATDVESIRFPADRGIAGQCARSREIINVPDCYADPRFDPSTDKQSGYRTRCMLTLPLIDSEDDRLVGVMQILNKIDGVFDAHDQEVAAALAAHCAVALQRTRATEKMLLTERLQQEIAVAHEIQTGTLPDSDPELPGYDVAGRFIPADETGGDLFDFVPLGEQRLMVLMGDATGHGIGPALSATQVRAMNRLAVRLGAGIEETVTHINDQLAVDLPDDRFVTAFLGILDSQAHQVHYHSAGQGPLLHFHAADGRCDWLAPSSFALGFMADVPHPPAEPVELAPGDILALISDGIYEYEDGNGDQFGRDAVGKLIRNHGSRSMKELIDDMLRVVRQYGGDQPQIDDITVVLLRRDPHG
ncbi:MAG: SpoIIE family protein phosphatase [Xanthomonadales bacterium]|nr:SpoIIE family protein phosphatase [Xanthomonadales bacterium]